MLRLTESLTTSEVNIAGSSNTNFKGMSVGGTITQSVESRLHVIDDDATVYDPTASADGQVGVGTTILVDNTSIVVDTFAQIVFRSRGGNVARIGSENTASGQSGMFFGVEPGKGASGVTEAMRIHHTGKVGIGDFSVTEPRGELDVLGEVLGEGFYIPGSGTLLPVTAGTGITVTPTDGKYVVATSGGGNVSKASETFASSTEWQMTHGLTVTAPQLVWATYDDGMEAIIPQRVDMSDGTIAYFYYAVATAGTAVLIG